MLLEDAQWHLSACLNFQFCNANVEKTQIIYDTIFTTINVNNGCISLSDINASLQEISTKVLDIYNSSCLENKNVLYIKPEIQDEAVRGGNTIRTVVATSGRDMEFYYLELEDYIELTELIPRFSEYHWSNEAPDTIKYYANFYKHTKNKDSDSGRLYYVTIESVEDLDYSNTGGRIYCGGNPNDMLNGEEIIYYLDSYLGIIDDYEKDLNLHFIALEINGENADDSRDESIFCKHVLDIDYGMAFATTLPPGSIVS